MDSASIIEIAASSAVGRLYHVRWLSGHVGGMERLVRSDACGAIVALTGSPSGVYDMITQIDLKQRLLETNEGATPPAFASTSTSLRERLAASASARRAA